MTPEQILHKWDTHVSEPCAKYPFTDNDKIAFARAIIAQARAELTPDAWWNGVEEANDIEIPSFSKTPDAQHPYALAIIPTKEGHEQDQ